VKNGLLFLPLLFSLGAAAAEFDYSFLPDPLLRCDGKAFSRAEGIKILEKTFKPRGNTAQAEVRDRLREAITDEFCRRLLTQKLKEKMVVPSGKMVMDYLKEREGKIPLVLRSKYAPSMSRKRELAADRDYRLSIALREYFLRYNKEMVQVNPAEIEWFYRCHQDQFMYEGKMNIAFIGVAGHSEASKEAIERANARLLQGEPFGTIAEEYNKKLPDEAFSAARVPQELVRIGSTLAPGATSGILKLPYGYAIVKLQHKAEPKYLTLEEVTPFIKETIRSQILSQELKKMLSKEIRSHKFEFFF